MTKNEKEEIVKKVKQTLIQAGSTLSADKKYCYQRAIEDEGNQLSKWAMQTIDENGKIAELNRSPLCDDTGIPHVILEAGSKRNISGELLDAVFEGIQEGLKELPGRPMAIKGSDWERITQSRGLDEHPEAVIPAPLLLRKATDDYRLRATILMQGGGPEIRAKTYRIFHRHNMEFFLEEIISWARESIRQLGCSPCTIAVGVGRSHYEAGAFMLQAMAEGNYLVQTELEKKITEALNKEGVGAMGLGGDISVLGTFMKIGPQRASGVRIVCMRPCCCFEPRKAEVDL